MTKRSIAFFARTPELGKVKTRLAKDIGDERALEVYQVLYTNTIEAIDALDAEVFAFITGEKPLTLPKKASVYYQIESDLGARMLHAFETMHAAHGDHPMILVGTDVADLSADILNTALAQLSSSDLVLGRSMDGGYYLIGSRKTHPPLFLDRQWSHSNVFQEALDTAQALGLNLSFAPVLNDIDVIADLHSSSLWKELGFNQKKNDNTTE